MAEPFTIYKLTILYMLDKSSIPLSNTQISNFFLDWDYTDYFNIQEALSELQDSDLIIPRPTYRNTQYLLTTEGKKTLRLFQNKITEGMAADVNHFLEKNQIQLREENSAIANYYRTTNAKYAAHCQVFSDGDAVIDLTITVPNKKQAETICKNWTNQNQEVYTALMDLLLQ